MEIIQDEFISQSRRRVTFSFSDATHLSTVFSPGPQYDLVKWSLTPEIPKPMTFYQGRPTYFLSLGEGYSSSVWKLLVTLPEKESCHWMERKTRLVDINLVV